MIQQQTQHITEKELIERRKEEDFQHECQHKAALACDLLRKQLRDQEMNDLIERMYSSNPPQKQDFVFVSRKEVEEELDKRSMLTINDIPHSRG